MNKTRILRPAIILSLTLASATALAASVILQHPGAKCVTADDGPALTVRNYGQAYNDSDEWVTAICPVERPLSPTHKHFSGKVFVSGGDPENPVCCRAISKNALGAVKKADWSCNVWADGGADPDVLNPSGLTDPYTYSAFAFECTMPPDSRIKSYRSNFSE